MKKLAILGAGGHGKVVADAASLSRQFSDIVFVDHNKIGYLGQYQILEELALDTLIDEYVFVIAIGDNSIRRQKYLELKQRKANFANIIHPAAVVANDLSLGEASVVFAGAVVNPGATLASNIIINTSSIVEHDCCIADNVHIGPGTALAGAVKVGKNTLIGLGSRVLPGVTIGDNVIVGAGSVILHNVPSGAVVVGSPARKIKLHA